MTTRPKRLPSVAALVPLPLIAATAAIVASLLLRNAIAPYVVGSSVLAAAAVVGVATALRRSWPDRDAESPRRPVALNWRSVSHVRGLFCEIVSVGHGVVRTRFRNGRTEPIWIGWHFLDEPTVRGVRLEPGEVSDDLANSESMLVSIWECKGKERRAAAERRR